MFNIDSDTEQAVMSQVMPEDSPDDNIHMGSHRRSSQKVADSVSRNNNGNGNQSLSFTYVSEDKYSQKNKKNPTNHENKY